MSFRQKLDKARTSLCLEMKKGIVDEWRDSECLGNTPITLESAKKKVEYLIKKIAIAEKISQNDHIEEIFGVNIRLLATFAPLNIGLQCLQEEWKERSDAEDVDRNTCETTITN